MNDDRIITVPIHTVKPHPRNEEFYDNADPESFQRLKDSIAEVGMLTPIRISKNYTIISGHQRYRACQELGVEFIQVVIDNELEDEDEMLMQLIVSNFGRMKNDPIKQGAMIAEYEKLRGATHGGDRKSESSGNYSRLIQSDIAKEFGCDVTTLRNLKRLAKLPPEVQEIVRSGKLSPTTAVKVIAPLPVEDQLKLIQSLPEASKRLTQAAVQAEVTKLRDASIEAERTKEAAEEAIAEADKAREDAQADFIRAKETVDSLRSQLNDAQTQLAQQPREVEVPPSDYESLKAEAQKARSLAADNEVLKSKIAELEQKAVHPPEPPEVEKPPAPAPEAQKPISPKDAQDYEALFAQAYEPLRTFVKGVVANLVLCDSFSPDFHTSVIKIFPKIAADLVTIADFCIGLPSNSNTDSSAGIQF